MEHQVVAVQGVPACAVVLSRAPATPTAAVARMLSEVARPAQPANFERFGIIVVVGFGLFGAASLAGLANDPPGTARNDARLPSLEFLFCCESADHVPPELMAY